METCREPSTSCVNMRVEQHNGGGSGSFENPKCGIGAVDFGVKQVAKDFMLHQGYNRTRYCLLGQTRFCKGKPYSNPSKLPASKNKWENATHKIRKQDFKASEFPDFVVPKKGRTKAGEKVKLGEHDTSLEDCPNYGLHSENFMSKDMMCIGDLIAGPQQILFGFDSSHSTTSADCGKCDCNDEDCKKGCCKCVVTKAGTLEMWIVISLCAIIGSGAFLALMVVYYAVISWLLGSIPRLTRGRVHRKTVVLLIIGLCFFFGRYIYAAYIILALFVYAAASLFLGNAQPELLLLEFGDDLHHAFDSIDKDKNGQISFDEFGQVLRARLDGRIHESKIGSLVSDLMYRADVDHDGLINYKEFEEMMRAEAAAAPSPLEKWRSIMKDLKWWLERRCILLYNNKKVIAAPVTIACVIAWLASGTQIEEMTLFASLILVITSIRLSWHRLHREGTASASARPETASPPTVRRTRSSPRLRSPTPRQPAARSPSPTRRRSARLRQ